MTKNITVPSVRSNQEYGGEVNLSTVYTYPPRNYLLVQNSDDEQQVSQLEQELIEAFRHGDTATLRRILADDFVFTSSRGASITKEIWFEDFNFSAFTCTSRSKTY